MRANADAMMSALMGPGHRPGRNTPRPPDVVEGRILEVVAGGVRFTVPDWDPTFAFGPAPWPRTLVEPASDGDAPHDHEGSVPAVGDRCLAILVRLSDGSVNPWVVGWWPA